MTKMEKPEVIESEQNLRDKVIKLSEHIANLARVLEEDRKGKNIERRSTFLVIHNFHLEGVPHVTLPITTQTPQNIRYHN